MEAFLVYLLKAAALSSIFLAAYLLLLKNDSSFQLNRRFLFGGIIASVILPSMVITKTLVLSPTATNIIQAPNKIADAPMESFLPIGLWQVVGIVYFVVAAFLLFRFVFRLFSLLGLISQLPKSRDGDFVHTTSEEEIQPFSFFHFIVFNPKLHSPRELEIILQHEKVHARQWHSIDVLLVNLAAILLWFNPLNWWYRNHVVQNLEYIADKETVGSAISKKEYQYALVKISTRSSQSMLTNNFYQSFTKKRIMMLNKKASQQQPLWKVSLIVPFILIFMFFFNIRTEAQVPAAQNQSVQESPQPLIVIDGKTMDKNFDIETINPNNIASINVLKDQKATEKYGEKAEGGVIEITLKADGQAAQKNNQGQKSTKIRLDDLPTGSILYILDGEKMDEEFDPQELDPNEIESVHVLKGEMAIEKYGERATAGAVEINTKG